MEEILASIRRIIADDEAKPASAESLLLLKSLRLPRSPRARARPPSRSRRPSPR